MSVPTTRQPPGPAAIAGVAALAAAAVLLGAGQPAAGFERTQTCSSFGTNRCQAGESPKPIYWPTRCVRYRVHRAGSADFPGGENGGIGNELHDLVHRAFETWNAPSCTDFTLVEGALTSKSATYDTEKGRKGNTNVVVWHDEEWPHESMPSAFALTSVSFTDDGAIEDADIEFNSSMYNFTHLLESKTGEMTTEVDLQNTLTHEIGHFIGLAHADNPKATMLGSAHHGEIRKRTLHQNDIDGLCAIYPGTGGQGSCDEPQDFRRPRTADERPATESGCSTTGGRPPLSFAAVVLAGLFAFTGRLRRRS